MPGILRREPTMVEAYNATQPGALSPVELAMYQHFWLPLYDRISKKSRQPGQLTEEDAAWDAMVERFKNYQPPSPQNGIPGINGVPVSGPRSNPLPPPIIGVRG